MKLKPKEIIKNFPPRLKELIIKRVREQYPDMAMEIIEGKNTDSAMTWNKTLEKDTFWSVVYSGREIPDEWGDIDNYQIY